MDSRTDLLSAPDQLDRFCQRGGFHDPTIISAALLRQVEFLYSSLRVISPRTKIICRTLEEVADLAMLACGDPHRN